MHRRYPVNQKAFFCLLILLPLAGIGQTSFKTKIEAAPVKAYTVGDKLPDLVFKNLINYKSEKASLHSLKGKLILVDFWELGCMSCIAAFPKMQKILQQFDGKMEVITVTRLASRQEFEQAVRDMRALKDFSFPTVLQDDILHKYFPYEAISHVVWIDGNGVVKAITGTEYVTPENVALALKEEHLPWPVKKDVIGFEYKKPLLGFVNSEAPVPASLYYSALGSYMEGIDALDKEIYDSSKGTVTYNHFNKSLLSLCDGSLFGQGTGYINPKYLLLEVKDKRRFLRDDKNQYYEQWAKDNMYCYSVTLPLSLSTEQRRSFIKKDLTRWLDVVGVSVKKEIREVTCYSLVLLRDNRKEVEAHGTERDNKSGYPYDSSRFLNETISRFISTLNTYYNDIPFLLINGTGYPDDFRINL
ncbi:MAG TPA: TlpA disulfide reductase family protein, partial [Pseudobacter sp.]|nr:TlpA disulfide reductase family protein [Pseudobacter sp.]